MNRIIIFLTAFVLLAFASCSSQKYHTTRVQNLDFNQFKTYSWLEPVDSLSKDYYNNDIAKGNIMTTANKEIEARGLTYSKENPDILFRYIAIVNNKSRIVYSTPYYAGWGWGGPWGWRGYWGWGGYYGGSYPVAKERVRYGHLIFEAIDRKTNSVIWQARGTTEVNEPEKAINALPKTVTGIMKEYPLPVLKK